MSLSWMLVAFLLAIFFVLGLYATHEERKNFNKGYCKNCNNKLENFDNDSQGGRGYICRECGYITWVSYPIDKKVT